MESEARLRMIDAGLPTPELQYEIIDRCRQTWRVDFAWPDARVAVEYDGFDFHSSPEDLLRDRRKRSALQEVGWVVVSILSDDVRRRWWEMARRIETALDHAVTAA
jgi:very-short-patch-repair endonuclease